MSEVDTTERPVLMLPGGHWHMNRVGDCDSWRSRLSKLTAIWARGRRARFVWLHLVGQPGARVGNRRARPPSLSVGHHLLLNRAEAVAPTQPCSDASTRCPEPEEGLASTGDDAPLDQAVMIRLVDTNQAEEHDDRQSTEPLDRAAPRFGQGLRDRPQPDEHVVEVG